MYPSAGPIRFAGLVLGVLFVGSTVAPAQTSTEGFITGATAQAWTKWFDAMQALLDRDPARAETAFGELLALDPSPFRVALLADHTVQRTAAGGAVLLFEQDMEMDALGPNGQAVARLLIGGREQMNQADDGFYFCQVGRFDVAEANFRALLDADPDPVAVLEFTDRVPKRRDILVQLAVNVTVGQSVRDLLRVLDRGERAIKADPARIRENIERLGGPPRGYENACEALKASGEYAIPFIVQTLRDPAKRELLRPVVRCLPQIDRPALNPLVMALRMHDDTTRRYVTEALAQIGYRQAVPYLMRLLEDPAATPMGRQDAAQALEILAGRTGRPLLPSAAQAFLALAEEYYADKPSLAADARLDTANVWYWRDDLLQNVEVPTPIFNEIMCMRCCEEALQLDPGLKPALALWLAANVRREAQLPPGHTDPTRPDDFPPSSYFAQSAGPTYCLMALARAVDDGDPAVALGMVEALYNTAGPASLLADAAGRLPLAEALSFPDRMVRIRAAITLGRGRPLQTFLNHQNLMPVLAEALTLHGGARAALIVDPDAASANVIAGVLRDQGYEVLIETGLLAGLERVRKDLPAVDVFFIASDIREPELAAGLGMLRSEFRFAAAPVVLVSKPGSADLVRALVRANHRLTEVPAGAGRDEINRAIATVSRAVGAKPITPDVGVQLAFETGQVLRDLALTNNPVFNVADVESALLTALGSSDVALRVLIAEVLGYLGSSKAQEAIADIALDEAESEDMRLKMFAALTEAAKRRGNLLGDHAIRRIITIVESEPNMTLREAASATLGALNVPGEPASTLIRHQYRG